jgi:hypothetical protein
VALATASRQALVGLPMVEPPADLGAPALAEAGLRSSGVAASSGPPRWYRALGLAAAAAAILLLVVIVLPSPKGGDGDRRRSESQEGVEDPTGEFARANVTLETNDIDYTSEDLGALLVGGESPATMDASAGAAAPESAPLSTGRDRRVAIDCVASATSEITGTLTRLIRARFQGNPAYLAIFVDGPGAGQPDDTTFVYVVGIDGCSILSFSQAKI